MSRRTRKPSGSIGPVEVEGRTVTFSPIRFPKTKEGIEEYILESAVREAAKLDSDPFGLSEKPTRNSEDSFDFTLFTRRGVEYLDLMEAAPLHKVKGSYETVNGLYNFGLLADAVWEMIEKKSTRYGMSPKSVIHLLLYTTAFQFSLVDELLDLLAFWSLERSHAFESIWYYIPLDQDKGNLKRVYPRSKEEFATFDEIERRSRNVGFADFSQMEVQSDGSFVVRFPPKNEKP